MGKPLADYYSTLLRTSAIVRDNRVRVERQRTDLPGALVATLATGLLTYGLVNA